MTAKIVSQETEAWSKAFTSCEKNKDNFSHQEYSKILFGLILGSKPI